MARSMPAKRLAGAIGWFQQSWPRIAGALLALGLHGAAIYVLLPSASDRALSGVDGAGAFDVAATITLESGDLFTQSAQAASPSARAEQQTAPKPKRQEPADVKTKPEALQESETETIEPQKPEAPQEKQETRPKEATQEKPLTQVATASAEAQDEQQAAAAAARRSKAWSRYETELYTTLERHKVKPRVRKNADVFLQITIASSGELVSRSVLRSSGVPELDGAALASLERARPFPPVPPEIGTGALTLTVPFQYRTR